MKRRTVLQAALAGTAALTLPRAARAQTPRKLSYLTWNIADQEQLFKEEFADFRKANPGVEIEWLDKKGPDLPAFYQTQLVAGTAPDVVDLQGAPRPQPQVQRSDLSGQRQRQQGEPDHQQPQHHVRHRPPTVHADLLRTTR